VTGHALRWPVMEPPSSMPPAPDQDRDLSTLEDAERDLAELERALRRLDGVEEPSDG
jgi:hypothetical protein